MARFVEQFSEALLGEDVFVFFKTPWVEMVYDEKLKRKVWRRTNENYAYALRPYTMIHGSRVAAEAYTIWAGRLQKIRSNVLDPIVLDEPLDLSDECVTDDERTAREKREDYAAYDALVIELAKEHITTKDSVIVEDARSWQKDKNTQKWRKELKAIQDMAIEDAEEAKSAVA